MDPKPSSQGTFCRKSPTMCLRKPDNPEETSHGQRENTQSSTLMLTLELCGGNAIHRDYMICLTMTRTKQSMAEGETVTWRHNMILYYWTPAVQLWASPSPYRIQEHGDRRLMLHDHILLCIISSFCRKLDDTKTIQTLFTGTDFLNYKKARKTSPWVKCFKIGMVIGILWFSEFSL